MFFDWLSLYQEFDFDLPFIGNQVELVIDTDTGLPITERQPQFKHEGSFSTSISIRISGRRLTVKGNPSRINRLDNLFGLTTVDACVSTYNQILLGLGLPPFTRCTEITWLTGKDGKKALSASDGAIITEMHITTNKSVGEGNVLDYIKGLSTQRYRNSIPRLHSNGATVDWLSKRGNASLIYPSVYDKATEIELHQLQKIKRAHGTDSDEFRYLLQVLAFCKSQGVARFEQKLKSRFIRREGLQFWGISDYSKLDHIHNEFLDIDKCLEADAMTYQTLAQQLIDEGICRNMISANATANYFFMWLHGQRFDLTKTQVQLHRARLRKLHIDIAEQCDVTKFSPVRIKESREIEVRDLAVPDWYRQPAANHLRLVA